MLFNNARCRALTPDYVNNATGLQLHRFQWLDSDDLIGEIPHRWNMLVGYDKLRPLREVSNLHYTIGGPYFREYRNTDYAATWFVGLEAMLRCDQRVKGVKKKAKRKPKTKPKKSHRGKVKARKAKGRKR